VEGRIKIESSLRFKSFLVIVVVVCFFSLPVYGQPWDGNGIEGDPYQIWDANDMQAIGVDATYWGAHFLLMADIDLGVYTGTSFNIIGKGMLAYQSGIALDIVGGKLYWTDSGTQRILRANLDGTGAEDLVTTELSYPCGIALDAAGGKMYWTDYFTDKICRANLDGTVIEDLITTGLSYPYRIAIDSAGGKMYWTDAHYSPKISRANFDGTGIEDLVTTGLSYPYGIALDAAGGKMYWTDYYTNKIQRANLDGTGVEDVVTDLGDPGGIALDISGGKMYWTDLDTDKIQRANLDGSGVEDLVTTGLDRPRDIALDVASGKMYWIDEGSGKVQRANFDGSEIEDLITRFVGVFDGGGHTISNFTYDSNGVDYVGLFGFINDPNGEVKNLGLLNPNVNAGDGRYVGALAGFLFQGSVTGCYVEGGSVTGGDYVGGLVGYNTGIISGCYSTGVVSGEGYVGGLVGCNWYSISNCYSTGSVTGDDDIGGLVGHNDFDISNCYSTGSVTGDDDVGGLVGSRCRVAVGSFWDVETSGVDYSATGRGLTTALLQDFSTFAASGWVCDESEVWTIDDGNDYPRLAWENKPGELLKDILYGGGNGTESEPYLIYTAQHLNAIGSAECNMDKHFKLMADIDLSAYTGTSFNIIGNHTFSDNEPFSGVFDGNGHSVRNFTYHDINGEGVGIFGYLGENSEVRDVYVEDANVVGYYWVGLLVALNAGTVSNCSATGKVLGEQNVGGLVGMNVFDSVIENCSTNIVIEIKGDDFAFSVGGLVGYNFYGKVTNSFANGIILGGTNTSYTGGLAGFHRGGEITGCYANVPVSGTANIGGLIGTNEGAVNSCYSTGDVNCVFYGGGLIGRMGVGVVDCYATANVNVEEYAGGLIGWDLWGGATNCYSTGAVNGTTGVGGLVGNTLDENVIYESCFWDSDNNPDMNGIGNRNDPNVTGLPTVLMQTESTFTNAGWDFVGEVINGPNDIWKMNCEGMSYPKLSWWEPALGDFICPDGVNFIDYSFFAEHWYETDYGDVNGVELSGDGKVNWEDFGLFAAYWMVSGCGNCGGADFTGEGDVNYLDLGVFAGYWLES